MHDVMRVAESNNRKKLFKQYRSITLAKLSFSNNFIKEFATLDMFSYNIETLFVFKVFIYLNNIWMIKTSKSVNLIDHSFTLLFSHTFLFKYFHSAFFFCFSVSAETNFTVSPLSEYMPNLINVTKCALGLKDKHFRIYLYSLINHMISI